MRQTRHSPQGECGLKYGVSVRRAQPVLSLPARGVWIEMSSRGAKRRISQVTPRKGSVD